jgi:hypothetical protein
LFRGALDDEQSKRFDAFRSAIIPKNAIKKVGCDDSRCEDCLE